MITTVTANPSIDRTIELQLPIARGEVQRGVTTAIEPGGKGVNVSRALHAGGVACTALFPAREHDAFIGLLVDSGVRFARFDVAGSVRQNIALVEPDGVTTKINEPGAALSDDEQEAFVELIIDSSRASQWLVLAGSLPPGVAPDFYARAVDAVRERLGDEAPRIAVDTSGDPLTALIASPSRVDLIKPNAFELAEIAGGVSGDELEADVSLAAVTAQRIASARSMTVLATLGARGAVLATPQGAWVADAPRIRARSTVGAGDSSLAGYLLAVTEADPPARCLARAVQYGAAAASLPGTAVPTRASAEAFTVVSEPFDTRHRTVQPAKPEGIS